ncbi:MAG: EamA family transporter [Clostridia bacterium]|nr:EamA family transporter [Clostridia bacterium]
MIYLLLNMICGAMLSIVIRFSEGRVRSSTGMIACNYLTCMVMAGCFLGFGGRLLPSAEGFGKTFGLGMLNGVFFMTAMMANRYNIKRVGMVLPSLFSKLGALLVPLVISIFLFGEMPGVLQVAGFALAIVAIVLMNLRSGKQNVTPSATLFLLLLTEGLASSMSKVYRETGNPVLSDHFLLFTFTSAFLLCIIVLLLKHERLGGKELLFGAMIGIPNFLAARFVLKALEALPAIIVYPCRSVGTIVIITLAGLFIFKERLSRRQVIAMLVIFVALVLLNI